MKRYRKIIYIILMACIMSGTALGALDFMGVVKLNGRAADDNENVSVIGNGNADAAGGSDMEEPWHIVFKGYAFSVEPVGTAIIHESGCLNIRRCDDYLIQIDVEDGIADEFWNDRDERVKSIVDSAYVMELPPEKLIIHGREYIRYVVSLAGERGAEFDRTYFCVLITDAEENQRFLSVIKFDKTNIDSLNVNERETVYEKASDEAAAIVDSAAPSDETNDMTGSYWQEEQPMDAEGDMNKDTVSDGDTVVSYDVPEGYRLMNDDQSGKTYYSDNAGINVNISTVSYTWLTASDMAEAENGAGISKVLQRGQYNAGDKEYYYYTYSVMYIKDGERRLTYNFYAYTDLKNGDIYAIHGFGDDAPEVVEPETYNKFMDIIEQD